MPILKLNEGAGEIARGNLEYLVEVSAKDEIGELGKLFQQDGAFTERAQEGA